MLAKIWNKLDAAERRFRHSFGKDISTPKARFWAKVHYHLFDHAFLRILWTNFYQLAPDVWRSNQPTHARFRKYADMGIRTVINLRGSDSHAHYLFEKESCDQLGLTLIDVKIHARNAAARDRIVAVVDALRDAPRPMMFHCKSGADRAGLTAAMYMMIFEGKSVDEAMKQLSFKYVHLSFTKTGIQDYILRVYKARLAHSDIGYEDWLRTEYWSTELQEGWDNRHPEAEVAEKLRLKAQG